MTAIDPVAVALIVTGVLERLGIAHTVGGSIIEYVRSRRAVPPAAKP